MPGAASQWLASFHLPLGHILNPVRIIGIGLLIFSIVLKILFCSSSREAAVLELPDRLILDITVGYLCPPPTSQVRHQQGYPPPRLDLAWYPPPPPTGVNRLKTLPSLILRMRSVKIGQISALCLFHFTEQRITFIYVSTMCCLCGVSAIFNSLKCSWLTIK